jgi:alpha-N-arabinofuranosidase
MALRNCDIIGMTNYAPVVNTRGLIFTSKDGIVLRSTYHVYDLFVNELFETVLDAWTNEPDKISVRAKDGSNISTDALDLSASLSGDGKAIAIAAINKDPEKEHVLEPVWRDGWNGKNVHCTVHTLSGKSTESYNDVQVHDAEPQAVRDASGAGGISLPPHSVNIIRYAI